jgi:hypothetical protein
MATLGMMSRRVRPAAIVVLAACGAPAAPTPTPVSEASTSPEPDATSVAGLPDLLGPRTEAWEVIEEAPFARLEMAVTAHDGRIWLAGGLSPSGEALAEVAIFDPATWEWTDAPPLPTGVHHGALVSDGERLIFIGGYIGSDFSRPSEFVLVLDGDGASWTEGPALPEARAAGAAAFDGMRVVYAGGVAPGGVVPDVFVLIGDTWERIGQMSHPREHLAATSDGSGTVWLLGGRVGGLDSNMADVEIVAGGEIAHVGLLPTPRGGVAAFYTSATGACLTGGEAPEQAYTVVECIAADGAVRTLPQLNEPHHGHGAAVVDGVAYVLLGGLEPTLSAGSTVEMLDVDP